MLTIKIPGREELNLSHLILDYNGTIAEDGEIIESIRPRLAELAKVLSIYVITADTHGTAARKCEGLPLEVLVEKAGGIIAGKMAILAEGDAQDRADLIYLEKLPLFHPDGTVMA